MRPNNNTQLYFTNYVRFMLLKPELLKYFQQLKTLPNIATNATKRPYKAPTT